MPSTCTVPSIRATPQAHGKCTRFSSGFNVPGGYFFICLEYKWVHFKVPPPEEANFKCTLQIQVCTFLLMKFEKHIALLENLLFIFLIRKQNAH
jgi:hypothetical protein